MRTIAAVIFDLGGVVVGSPLDAIRDYERELGIERNAINHMIVRNGAGGAWSRLERGELELEAFFAAFDVECAAAGHGAFEGREMMLRIGRVSQPRPEMLEAIRRIRAGGLRTAALTNNWATDDAADSSASRLGPLFDDVVESSAVGLRKPDPRIYELACQRIDVTPREAVFLDDIGSNLKAARALGMTTIKVEDPHTALTELSDVLGMALR